MEVFPADVGPSMRTAFEEADTAEAKMLSKFVKLGVRTNSECEFVAWGPEAM